MSKNGQAAHGRRDDDRAANQNVSDPKKSNGKTLSEEDREKRNEIIKKIEEGEKQ